MLQWKHLLDIPLAAALSKSGTSEGMYATKFKYLLARYLSSYIFAGICREVFLSNSEASTPRTFVVAAELLQYVKNERYDVASLHPAMPSPRAHPIGK